MKLRHKTITLDDGFRVGVTTAGRGTPLVFLHGLTLCAEAYAELFLELAHRGFRVIALDAANHGRTDSLPWGHTVADMIGVTARALTHLGIHHAVMVGHSMGGGMVVEFAAKHPDRTAAAILLNAAAGEEHHDGLKAGSYPALAWRAARKLATATVDLVCDSYQAGKFNVPKSGLRCVRAALALLRADTVPLLSTLRANAVRTAVIHSEFDQIVPFAAGASAARAAAGRLYEIRGGFHSWMLTDPQLAGQVIAQAYEETVVAAESRAA